MALHLALTLLAIAPFTFAQDISACKDQGCSDCPVYAFATNGFPDCVIYNSADNLGGYEVESGNGYRVWWNSGQPGDNCQVYVSTFSLSHLITRSRCAVSSVLLHLKMSANAVTTSQAGATLAATTL